ncbi:hypothetical protein [Peribacillus sp. NPDC097295]|uniref:hypothetical protein n=1 Tax=Peribacillus sp. NPDC097295 TaxID=3364402 RepID=UPI003822D0E0
MRKLLIILVTGILLVSTTPAFAHLTGAFAEFLDGVNDESTTEKLKREMEETKKDLLKISPKVDEMEQEYKDEKRNAMDKLQLYSDVGLDSWLGFLMEGENLVDIMGSQWLMERNLQSYIDDLNTLYLHYKQLESAKNSMAGHQELLKVIEGNLVSREKFLSDNPGLDLEQLANYLDIDWVSEVEESLIEKLGKDTTLTEKEAGKWAMAETSEDSYRLDEKWLNERSDLQYFFRSDHVYLVYNQPDLHVLLLGQVLQESKDVAQLKLEAGYFNGFLLPDTLVDELEGFKIPYSQFERLAGISEMAHLEQTNGALILRPE